MSTTPERLAACMASMHTQARLLAEQYQTTPSDPLIGYICTAIDATEDAVLALLDFTNSRIADLQRQITDLQAQQAAFHEELNQ